MNIKNQTALVCRTNSLKIVTVITLGILLTAIDSLSANAQTSTLKSDYLEDIEAGQEHEWNFSGTSESVSIKDEIEDLAKYNISEVDSADVELVLESKNRYDRRGIENYFVEIEVYDD